MKKDAYYIPKCSGYPLNNGIESMDIKRDFYLNKLIDRKHDTYVKIITGIRRCGKSYF